MKITLEKRIRRDLRAAKRAAAKGQQKGVAIEFEAEYGGLTEIDKRGDWLFNYGVDVQQVGGVDGSTSGSREGTGEQTARIRVTVKNLLAIENLEDEDDEEFADAA